jgi:hypothetical protein
MLKEQLLLPLSVLTEVIAVIAHEHDDSVVGNTTFLQLVK